MRLLFVLCVFWGIASTLPAQTHLKWNEIQCLGSHNSYRTRTDSKIERFVVNLSDWLPADYNPKGWAYSHAPLFEQLDLHGLRSFELDIHYDPEGGKICQTSRQIADPEAQEIEG